MGSASLLSAWAREGPQATSTCSCFSLFTVLATEQQYLPRHGRKVTFQKNKLKNYEKDEREESCQEGAVIFHGTSCWGNAAEVAQCHSSVATCIQGLILPHVKLMPNLPLHHWALNDGCIVVVMDANHHPGNEWKKLVLI